MTVIEPIQDLDDQTFNPYLADELIYGDIADPYRSAIDGLLARGPVVEGFYRDSFGMPHLPGDEGRPHFMVLSHKAVDHVLNDPITFSNKAFEQTLGRGFGHTISVMDPPERSVRPWSPRGARRSSARWWTI